MSHEDKPQVGSSLDWFISHELKNMIARLATEVESKPCKLSTISTRVPFPAGALNFSVGDEKDYVAYTIPNCGRIPEAHFINGEWVPLTKEEPCGEIEADPCHIVCLGQTVDSN